MGPFYKPTLCGLVVNQEGSGKPLLNSNLSLENPLQDHQESQKTQRTTTATTTTTTTTSQHYS